MKFQTFKEYLSKYGPEGGGEIWNNRSNSDLDFGRTGAKSKYVAPNKSGETNFDAEKLFKGNSKKEKTPLNNQNIFNKGTL
jgi:hypothetical protein